jgi:formylglycine-generating enzyme required for sulfatase activity
MTTDPPNWAVDSGEDHCGLWADLALKDVVQRFRWIEPGEFLMGSPDDEAERKRYEGPQHRVRISRGFWLADTACTQALWLAVMGGENPSNHVRDLRNPVEFVSWDEVRVFLQRLQSALSPDWIAVLPTEAQWEYACRAGTVTPFSFGDNVSSQEVNFNSDFPYRKSAKELWRGCTVPVKSLPPNPWGLYEMHGNVYEWCENFRRFYPDGPVTDPTTPVDWRENCPENYDHPDVLALFMQTRVLRGGSYFNDGRAVRSATRLMHSDRSIFFGFRFLLIQ